LQTTLNEIWTDRFCSKTYGLQQHSQVISNIKLQNKIPYVYLIYVAFNNDE